jgi:LuxR family maltose regulon positive regulatory protein
MPKIDQLIQTKFYIPPPHQDIVPRSRLIERLNTGLHRKLSLVSAPAGFGKTTLVSSWIHQYERPVAWISLDENDNDLRVFFTYFIAALQRIDLNIGVNILNTIQASQTLQVSSLLTMLVNEIDAIEEEIVLVLDDYHRISNQAVHDTLDFLIEHMPARMHLVISGRVDPNISQSRLRVNRQMNEIRSNDLRFTEAEASIFLNELMDLNLLPSDIAALEKRTEGWIAGLQLAALSLQGRKDKHEFVSDFSGSHRYIIDYLVEEVLSRQPEEILTFLCQTSILDRLSAPLCDATLDISTSYEILQQIEESNLFLIPLDEHREWYRYHHLFDDFLKQCLLESDSKKIPELHIRAAGWYEREGFIPEALEHYLKAKNFSSAASLVEQHAKELLEHSQLATLMSWVNLLPDEHVLSHPWICIYHAWALRLSGRPFDVVESRLQDAEKVLEKQGWSLSKISPTEKSILNDEQARRLMGHITTIRAFQALFRDDIPHVLDLAHQALEYQPDGTFLSSNIAFALGWAYRFSGDLEASRQAFIETSNTSLESGNFYSAVATKCRAAYGDVLAGRLHQAMESLREAVQIANIENGKQLPVAGYAYVYMGGVYREWNNLEAATQYSLDGIELCERVGYIMDQAVGYATLSCVKLAQKDWEAAQDALQKAEFLSQKMKTYVYVRRWVENCQIRLWDAQGNLNAIDAWIRESGLSVADELTFLRDIEHIILARALVVLGQANPESQYLDDALTLLTQLQEMTLSAGYFGKAIEVLVLQALALQAKDKDDTALKVLEQALSLAEPQGYVRTFVDEGPPMATLLRQAAAQGISMRYASRLLGTLESELQDEKSEEEVMPASRMIEPLSKREFEVLKMLATELSGPEIASEMHIALTTLRFHTRNIYGKLEVNNRRSAVRKAQEFNLI